MQTLKDKMMEAIFIKTGGRPENIKIAEICSEIYAKQVSDMLFYYGDKIITLDYNYYSYQDKDKSKINYKKRSKSDIREKEILEDIIADLERLNGTLPLEKKLSTCLPSKPTMYFVKNCHLKKTNSFLGYGLYL